MGKTRVSKNNKSRPRHRDSGDTPEGRTSLDKTRLSGRMLKSSTESLERKPSLSKNLPHSKRSNWPTPTTNSSRAKNSSQSGCRKKWLSWYQKPMTQKTLKATGPSVASQLCTRSSPPWLQKGPTSSSKATVCSSKCKKDATVEVMASSSSTKPPWGDEIQVP